MTKIKTVEIVEIYKKIGEITTDINNCKELSDEKKIILRGNTRSMLETIDLPDFFYGVKERVGWLVTVAVLVLFVISAFLTQRINDLWIIGAWILFILARIIYLPSLDDITLSIIKSESSALRRIFIKQKK